MDGLNKMCVFYAVIKPALGNIIRRGGEFFLDGHDEKNVVNAVSFKCTQEEAKKYPQFRWVSLEELG